MSNEVLAFVYLGCWLVTEGMALCRAHIAYQGEMPEEAGPDA